MINFVSAHRRLVIFTAIWAALAVAVLILEWNAKPDLFVMFLCWVGGIAATCSAYMIVRTAQQVQREHTFTPGMDEPDFKAPPHGG